MAELVMNGTWLIRAGNGEYLDLVRDPDGGGSRLQTVPKSRLRHAFRVEKVQDVETGVWSVAVEPVPGRPKESRGDGSPVPPAAEARSAPPRVRLPMQLAHHGCLDFELTAPAQRTAPTAVAAAPGAKRQAAPGAPMIQGTEALAAALAELPPAARGLTLEVDIAGVASTESGVPFPAFEGEPGRAYQHIEKTLGFDVRSEALDTAALDTLTRPRNITRSAWDEVMNQLRMEVHYRQLCKEYFESAEDFVRDVFIGSSGLVERVGRLIELDGNQAFDLHIETMVGSIGVGVAEAAVPGAGVVSVALSTAFEVMLRDRGPDDAIMAVALNTAGEKLCDTFDNTISAIAKRREGVLSDWGKLREMGKALENRSARWPGAEDDDRLRQEARRLMEISLWKDLLKLRWHHMTAGADGYFVTRYSDADKAVFERAHPQYWVEYSAGTRRDGWGKKEKGYYVKEHWLGYQNRGTLDSFEADAAMCAQLFGKLKVPRREVFTEASWGLERQRLYPKPVYFSMMN